LTLDDGDAATTDPTTTTDADGNYEFLNVEPGIYTVVEAQPAGYSSVSDEDATPEDLVIGDADGTVNDEIPVKVTAGESDEDNDFIESLTAIFGHVYLDNNNNGIQDAGDVDLQGVDVTITQSDNTTITVTTDANGDWMSPVLPGLTSAQVVESTLPTGVNQTEGVNPNNTISLAGTLNDGGIDGYAPGVPDITPIITFVPTNVNGVTDMAFTIKTQELIDVPTNGEITLILPKDDRLTFSYNPEASNIGPFAVENSKWDYDGSNGSFHIWKTTSVIEALSASTFGFFATYNPQMTTGEVTFTVTILTGSGAENNFLNNIDAETLDYFSN